VLQAIPPLHLPTQSAPACSHTEIDSSGCRTSCEVLWAINMERAGTPTPGVTPSMLTKVACPASAEQAGSVACSCTLPTELPAP